MSLEQRTLDRIAQEFPAPDQAAVIELLGGYSGPEPARVVWDVLQLSKGSLEGVRKYVKAAMTDYRDVLYWAEYFATDPMFKGHDAKKMVEEVLKKWGDKK